jgi:hypothetical protein
MLIDQCLWVFFVFSEKGWKRIVFKSFYTFFIQGFLIKNRQFLGILLVV